MPGGRSRENAQARRCASTRMATYRRVRTIPLPYNMLYRFCGCSLHADARSHTLGCSVDVIAHALAVCEDTVDASLLALRRLCLYLITSMVSECAQGVGWHEAQQPLACHRWRRSGEQVCEVRHILLIECCKQVLYRFALHTWRNVCLGRGGIPVYVRHTTRDLLTDAQCRGLPLSRPLIANQVDTGKGW